MSVDQRFVATPRPHFKRENSNDRTKFKPKAWTHQDQLKSLIGKKISIVYRDDAVFTGTLLNADQFTIQIQGPETVITVFKSALTCFTEVK